MVAGVRKRFAIKPPNIQPDVLARFRVFVKKWLEENLVPLSPDSDTSVDHWLEKTPYPAHRKEELRGKWSRVTSIWDTTKKYFWCKSFQKDEVYAEYKHARAINSRSDEFKCAVGPIFKLIEEVVYTHRSFIKHVPVAQRPEYIMRMLYKEGARYFATDYSAFESLFVRELMESCEFQLYEYMTSRLPDGEAFMSLVRTVLAGSNVCEFRDFKVELQATRMSGEMCTSLGNGFSNLMFMLFMCGEKGCTDVEGVVEGDDGLFTMVGTPPTADDFAMLGLIIKAEVHDSINTASFCGIVFDPEDKINVTDPREVLATLGWASGKYARSPKLHRALLRCKALSIAHQYPGCPIISDMAWWILRATRHVDIRRVIAGDRHMARWDHEQLVQAYRDEAKILQTPPGMNTRFLVEHLYGISVEHQYVMESYFKSLSCVQEVGHPVFELYMRPDWLDYWQRYVVHVDTRRPNDLNRPDTCWTLDNSLPVEF